MTANTEAAVKPNKWLTLHEVSTSDAVEPGQVGQQEQETALSEDTPACKAFRLRLLKTDGVLQPGAAISASMMLKVRVW